MHPGPQFQVLGGRAASVFDSSSMGPGRRLRCRGEGRALLGGCTATCPAVCLSGHRSPCCAVAVAWGLVGYLPVILVWLMGVGVQGWKAAPRVCPLCVPPGLSQWLGEGQEVWACVSWLRFKRGSLGQEVCWGTLTHVRLQDCGLHIMLGGLNGDIKDSRQRQ